MIRLKYFIIFLITTYNFDVCSSTAHLNKLGIQVFSSNGFGPYFAVTEKIEKCVNTRRPVDQNHYSPMNIGVRKLNRTKEIFTGYAYLPNDIQYHEVFIKVNYWKDGGFRSLYSNTIKSPCTDILMVNLLSFIHPDSNCVAKKGNYTFSLKGDLDDLLHLFAGDKIFYARLSFRLEMYSKVGTIFCIKVDCQTKPKRKLK